MILIVGATGVVGQRTARLLLAEGHRVRAMTRDDRRAHELRQQGAEVVVGDLLDRRSLDRACEGVLQVFAAAHALTGRGRYRSENVDDAGHRSLIDAAAAAGVRRFVYTSVLGASPGHPIDFFRTKHAIEQHLARSGLEWVVLRPAAFMEWHAHRFNGGPLLRYGRTVLLGAGTRKRNFVAAADVAQLAAMALVEPRMAGQIVEIGGPGNFSDTDVSRLYARLAGMEPRLFRLPRPLLARLAGLFRPIHPGISRVMRIASLDDASHDETFDCARLLDRYPMRLTQLEDFVQEQVTRHRGLRRS